MSTALVTGAAGFIGRHFTKHLRDQGWKVYAIDTVYADWLTDVEDARDMFRNWNDTFDLVIHAAAVVGGRKVIDHDPLAQAVNLELDAALFRWARRARPGRVIYFSSSAVYPVHLQSPGVRERMEEKHVLFGDTVGVPDQLYGWTKLTGEYLARLAQADGLAVSVVRPFSGYGEDQDETYPFGAFIGRALRREDPFLVWGTGNQVRDFIHVDDIVAAVMAMYEGERNGPVNLGIGQAISMRSLALKVCQEAGYAPQFEFAASAPAGVAYRVASPVKLFQFYHPKIALEQGIRRALEYRAALVPD